MSRLLACVVACLLAVPVEAAQAPEVVVEVRVHGNHTTPDATILEIAALVPGTPASEPALAAAAARLRDSGRFAAVDVRKRFFSIADPSQIVVILVVDEAAGVSDGDLIPGPLDRVAAAGMWLPILRYEDGYGLTYGARVSLVDPLGPHSRLSAPLTWGAERRAGLEADRTFDGGPLSRIAASVSIARRENPFYEIADTRREVSLHAERAAARWLRGGAHVRVSRVSFDAADSTDTELGAEITVDTRIDPTFPRNAVLATVGIERLRFGGAPDATRVTSDLRGYIGLVRSTVLAVRAHTSLAGTALPRYERALLGGAGTLRGTPAGAAAGDNLAAISAELRVPLTSPIDIGRFGVTAFVDAGTAWDVGQELRGRRFTQGKGVGFFFGASVLTVNVDVARSEGHTRWHVGAGVGF